MTCTALSLGFDRDGPCSSKLEVLALPVNASMDLCCKDDEHDLKFDKPRVIATGLHWLALYKPPFWQVSADYKEAISQHIRNVGLCSGRPVKNKQMFFIFYFGI